MGSFIQDMSNQIPLFRKLPLITAIWVYGESILVKHGVYISIEAASHFSLAYSSGKGAAQMLKNWFIPGLDDIVPCDGSGIRPYYISQNAYQPIPL